MFLTLRMEETYENTSQMQHMYKEKNEFSQNGGTQPASLPVYRELESNSEIQGNFKPWYPLQNYPQKT